VKSVNLLVQEIKDKTISRDKKSDFFIVCFVEN
jgi:hypothetical protein